MPIVNRIAAFDEDMKKWRRNIHQNPELGLDCMRLHLLLRRDFGSLALMKFTLGLQNQG